MKRPRTHKLSAKRAREYLETFDARKIERLSAQYSFDVYELSNGGVLLVDKDGKGLFYESHTEFMAFRDELEAEAARGPIHVLDGLLLESDAFINRIPDLVLSLARDLKLPESDLDGSGASLDKLDHLLWKRGSAPFLNPNTFLALVAYTGEIIRTAVHGRWELRLGWDNKTWEPWIVDPSGNAYDPFSRLNKVLYEEGKKGSIKATVIITSRQGRFRAS